MAPLTWNTTGTKIAESGVDRGVLYTPSIGIAWPGITAIELEGGDSPSELFYNGKKTLDLVTLGDFSGSIEAISYPDEFLPYEGSQVHSSGLIVHDQPPETFGFSFRSTTWNDVDYENYGYKIHVFYNLTATPSAVDYETLEENGSPITFSWDVTGVPVMIDGHRPSVHFIFDSTKVAPTQLLAIESMLYGTSQADPYLPPIETLLGGASIIVIIDNGDGTWTAIGPDEFITMLDANTFQITNANAIYLTADEYQISSS